MFPPMNVTSGESNGYLELNLNCSWNCSPSYKVPLAPSMWTIHCVKFWPARSSSTCTPGGGSRINDVSSFSSLLCNIFLNVTVNSKTSLLFHDSEHATRCPRLLLIVNTNGKQCTYYRQYTRTMQQIIFRNLKQVRAYVHTCECVFD